MYLCYLHWNSIPMLKSREIKKYFFEQIKHHPQQVFDILHKPNEKFRKKHDQHQIPHKYLVGDKMLLNLQKNMSQAHVDNKKLFDMGLTQSQRLWEKIILD